MDQPKYPNSPYGQSANVYSRVPASNSPQNTPANQLGSSAPLKNASQLNSFAPHTPHYPAGSFYQVGSAGLHPKPAGYPPQGHYPVVPNKADSVSRPVGTTRATDSGTAATTGSTVSASRSGSPHIAAVPETASSILEKLKQYFPGMPEKTLATAVRTRKTYEDSLRWLKQMQQRNLMPQAPPQLAQQPKHQTIRQKFSHLAYDGRQNAAAVGYNVGPHQSINSNHSMNPMMGSMQNRAFMPNQMMQNPMVPNQILAPQMMHGSIMPNPLMQNPMMQNQMMHHPMLQNQMMQSRMMGSGMSPSQTQPMRPPPRRHLDEEESEDDMSDSDNYDPYEAAEFDARLLSFLNTATAEAIADVSTQPMENVQALVKKRPFTTLAQAARVDVVDPTEEASSSDKKRKRGAAKKAAGLKIIDAARTTLRGYEAVDSLIKECSRLGKLVQQGIDRWELDEETMTAKGPTFFKEQPALLSNGTQLKNYQQVGINWLSLLYEDKLSCILADEMGLGKTLQVIAFLAHLKAKGDAGPHLVVCPASTLENWLRELQRFCPSLKVEAYYGGQPERREIREDIFNRPNSFDVMVTTYNLATGQKSDVGFLKSMGFNVVVYDEGHLLKNSQSERYNKLMKLKAKFRVLLTGTPLQNNLRELVSLLSFILPRLFTENRDDLLEVFRFKAKTTAGDSEKSRDDLLSEQRIKKAKTMMQPFILRRRKEQVLAHLPAKSHEVIFCDMTENQKKIYERELKRNKKQIQTAKEQVTEQSGGTKKAKKEAGKQLDNVLMQLRKAALHPLLFREIYTDAKLKKMAKAIMHEDVYKEANQTYIFEDMQVMNDFELDRLCRKFPITLGEYILEDEVFTDSGKAQQLIKMVKELLPENAPKNTIGNRILLFSQFTLVLDIIQRILENIGIQYLRMDGQTPVEVRQDLIDQFHNDENLKIFLLSTKAGGFGINLAVANKVIIFDLSFNPHDDKQAEDRAHRVGQTRPVHVHRLITRNTIEENILELANTKLALDKQVSEEVGLDDEDEIDTEKEAYVAEQLLGKQSSTAGSYNESEDDDKDEDDDEDEDEDDSHLEPPPRPSKRSKVSAPSDEDEPASYEDSGDDEPDFDKVERRPRRTRRQAAKAATVPRRRTRRG